MDTDIDKRTQPDSLRVCTYGMPVNAGNANLLQREGVLYGGTI